MSKKKTSYQAHAMTWLRMTGYMHGWLDYEFGGEIFIYGHRVLSLYHLPGVREILRMQTEDDILDVTSPGDASKTDPTRWAMSALRMDCMRAGISLGPSCVEQMYGVDKEQLDTFVPVECPSTALTANGVLRPWQRTTSLGCHQAMSLIKLLRDTFWNVVSEFDEKFTAMRHGEYYTTREMVEEFCRATKTPDLYAEELRREWQRKNQRESVKIT